MSYKGKYQPAFPKKYKGDPSNITYRSLWERKFMVYCDTNENILECKFKYDILMYQETGANPYKNQPKERSKRILNRG